MYLNIQLNLYKNTLNGCFKYMYNLIYIFMIKKMLYFFGIKSFRKRGCYGKKSFLATELFCFFLGILGIHRFYTGYVGLGIVQLLTFGGCGVWAFIDLISISLGKYRDVNGQELGDYNSKIGYGVIIFIVVVAALQILPSLLRG